MSFWVAETSGCVSQGAERRSRETSCTVCLINATPPGKKGPKAHGAGSAKNRRGGAAARGTKAPHTANAVVAAWGSRA